MKKISKKLQNDQKEQASLMSDEIENDGEKKDDGQHGNIREDMKQDERQ